MVQTIVDGLAMGIIYAVVALGMLLIFNAVRIVNFAQGQLLMVGSYFAVTFVTTLLLPTWLAYLSRYASWPCSASCSCLLLTFHCGVSRRT